MIDEREKARIEKFQAGVTTGASIKKMDANLEKAISMAISEMKLRQWCVEHAIKLASNTNCPVTYKDMLLIINTIYDFVINKEIPDDKAA